MRKSVVSLRNSLIIMGTIFLFMTVLVLPTGFSAAATGVSPNQQSVYQKIDSDFINNDAKLAKPLQFQKIPLKGIVDYSSYVTLTGNQDGWGGCIGRSIVHTMNILNEMKHPYTPDLSFWYLHVRQEQLANGGPVNTKYLLENYGLCPEATLPSDYDKAAIVNGALQWGNMPMPNATVDAEARIYKINLFSDPITPSVETMKYLLDKGPILAEGKIVKIQGPNPTEGHCITVVGYNDLTKSFKCLNSWGDTWGPHGNGYFDIGYDEVAANFTAIRYIEIGESERLGTKDAFSARIWIDTQGAGRRNLTVAIGREGQGSKTVWDTPNKVNCVDNSNTLKIDVPMPQFAFTVKENSARWYIEITNHGYGPVKVKELTLARLVKNADGTTSTKLQKYPASDMSLGAQATVKYYFANEMAQVLQRANLAK